MSGPPGSGKTMLARALPSILPAMTTAEALDVTKIFSVRGLLPADTPLLRERPFRAPHHTTSSVGLIGGGSWPRPGEVSLAHRGVLFLDELPEFSGSSLEMLRQPLEDRQVTLARAAGTVTFPANFTLIAAMNPCPCGYLGDPVHACRCSAGAIARYQKRISGPLLDRIDIHLEVPRVEYERLADKRAGEPSAVVRDRVQAARAIQEARYRGTSAVANADIGPKQLQAHVTLDATAESLLKSAVKQLNLSARAYHRVLKLARTIADLEGVCGVTASHVAEAKESTGYHPLGTDPRSRCGVALRYAGRSRVLAQAGFLESPYGRDRTDTRVCSSYGDSVTRTHRPSCQRREHRVARKDPNDCSPDDGA
jgi:magnesium chelatase family protein